MLKKISHNISKLKTFLSDFMNFKTTAKLKIGRQM